MTAVLQRPDTFKGLLLAATVLPVLCAFAFPLGLASETALPGQTYLFVMTFISVAHVPATLYLLFDRDLVGQSDLSRRQTVIVPLALIVFVPVLLLSVTPRAEGSPSPPLYFIWVAYLMWQHWHFGRQNLGVFTFCLMGPEGRRISDFERLTINLASLCGILAICGRYATALKQKYVGDAPLLVHDFLSSWVFEAGMALQIGLTIASILYLVRYLRSYTPLSATIYLCAVSFFLPMYFEPGFTLPHYAAGHGLQYMVFLAFHAVAMSNLGKPRTSEETASRIPVAACLLALVFLLGGLYHVAAHAIAGFVSHLGTVSGLFAIAQGRALVVVLGIDMGVTCAHFWYDSLIWKLRVPSRRKWAAERFAFMFR